MIRLRFNSLFPTGTPSGLPRSFTIGILSVAGLLFGGVPTLQPQASTLVFSDTASAQTVAITTEEVRNYARSVLAIEPIRQTAYDEIKRISGSNQVPAIACHRPDSLTSLGRDIRRIAVQYCNQAIGIVEGNALTITRFNTITTNLQSSPELATQIQDELIRLQQGTSTNP
ncbi:DUF4168 domain-containing protein [Oculatella sp. LEGE 06141]|uniref:DUF4168 domain-containing protein n=1 Tax=Oculatella sp. LEGE 06141 TaxID=1828648 RepID=UPI00187E3F04|nr:DUF4168 domain-containing protein [Oculatella sp. LEGE 06141]MBE9181349.1 DUF4168 domain-containing protein [Oculatella sp. LEGE 06141]